MKRYSCLLIFLAAFPARVFASVPSADEIVRFDAQLEAERADFEAKAKVAAVDPRFVERQKFNQKKNQERLALQDSLQGRPAEEQAARLNEFAQQLGADRAALEARLVKMAPDRDRAVAEFNEVSAADRQAMLASLPGLTADEQAQRISDFQAKRQADRAKLEQKLDETDPQRARISFEKKRAEKIRAFYA